MENGKSYIYIYIYIKYMNIYVYITCIHTDRYIYIYIYIYIYHACPGFLRFEHCVFLQPTFILHINVLRSEGNSQFFKML